MNYFDTSFLIPLFLNEETSSRVDRFIRGQQPGDLAISQWTRVEFSAVIGRQVRLGKLTPEAALDVDHQFDAIAASSFLILVPNAGDLELSKQFLRRYDIGLRAGDALHLAIASNHSARAIYSLDRGLVKAGQLLGLPAATGLRTP
jgi:predicted nucleic acid-binding protein